MECLSCLCLVKWRARLSIFSVITAICTGAEPLSPSCSLNRSIARVIFAFVISFWFAVASDITDLISSGMGTLHRLNLILELIVDGSCCELKLLSWRPELNTQTWVMRSAHMYHKIYTWKETFGINAWNSSKIARATCKHFESKVNRRVYQQSVSRTRPDLTCWTVSIWFLKAAWVWTLNFLIMLWRENSFTRHSLSVNASLSYLLRGQLR